ncbi:hypothetical protein DNTS_000526 [Danionella cerebrum]|uniref:Fibronectin type III domain-containing protein 7 n=1 Tax=Danionella cerebrum TaxID=2873325 RepID=A0A553PVX6_9TELE|nr:hypothetical protein DNTS_000526 [Danionella translucida]
MSADCSGQRSEVRRIVTGPCAPQNVSANVSCSSNIATVTWGSSPGAELYSVTASSANGLSASCSSVSTSCDLLNLTCGESYSITVKAKAGNCSSGNSSSVQMQTAPCPSTGIQTRLDCRSSSALISWTPGNGSSSFNATLQSTQDLQKYTCFTSSSSCNISSLPCGQHFNVSVMGNGQNCSTCSRPSLTVDTAPCATTQINVSLSCGSDTASVSWTATNGLVSYYLVTAEGDNGRVLTCNSSSTSCSISGLGCSQTYNFSVTAMSADCSGQRSEVRRIITAPCIPRGINGTVDCLTNSAWISWVVNNSTQSYRVLAVGDDGQNYTCISSNSTCNVVDLGCGRSYTFQVMAANAACMSPPSNSFQLDTAPCAMSSIVVVAECYSSLITVQWQSPQRKNSLYIATAVDQNHSVLSCNSSTSSCNLTNVQCGKEYTIVVGASANQCSSIQSPPYKIRTAPCQPTSVQAQTDCQTKNVFLSWDASYVAQSYLLTAIGQKGDLKTCNTTNNNCTLTNLNCSNTYNVSVVASNDNCTSIPSGKVTFQTVPCTPSNLTAIIQCGNSSASLSWVGCRGAVSYIGLAMSENGTTIYCKTTNMSCTLEGLMCGTVYNFTVQATNGICNSSLSAPQTVGAAPCPPGGLRILPRTVVNMTQTLRASWFTTNCPNSEYLLTLKGSLQGNSMALFDLASYWTSRTFFEMPLPCGSSYSATIRARNSAASGQESSAVTGTTVPCAPLNVTFSASLGVVAWNESIYASNYTAYGITPSGRTKLCITSQLHCSVSNFSSGQILVTAQNAAGESEDSLPVLVTVTSELV